MSGISEEVYNLVLSLGSKTGPIEEIIDYCIREYSATTDKASVISKSQAYAADSLVLSINCIPLPFYMHYCYRLSV